MGLLSCLAERLIFLVDLVARLARITKYRSRS
jgi:hypothetical protein